MAALTVFVIIVLFLILIAVMSSQSQPFGAHLPIHRPQLPRRNMADENEKTKKVVHQLVRRVTPILLDDDGQDPLGDSLSSHGLHTDSESLRMGSIQYNDSTIPVEPRDRSRSPPRSRTPELFHIYDTTENRMKYDALLDNLVQWPPLPAKDDLSKVFLDTPGSEDALERLLNISPTVDEAMDPLQCVAHYLQENAAKKWEYVVREKICDAFPEYADAEYTLAHIMLDEILCAMHARS